MVEGDNVKTLWEIRSISINNVLEVFAESFIQGVKIESAVNNSEKSKEFVTCKVFNYLLLHSLINLILLLVSLGVCLHCTTLHHKILENLIE